MYKFASKYDNDWATNKRFLMFDGIILKERHKNV